MATTTAVRTPLRMPLFRRIVSSYLINELGNGIGTVALAILVFDRTGSPLATAAMFVALTAFPAVLAPLLTARLEVASARRVLASLYLTEGAIFAVIALVARSFSLPLVLILCSFDGILAVTARALVRSAYASLLADTGLLRRGNALITGCGTFGQSVGPAVAGVLVAAAGAGVALAADAVSFAVAAVILFGARGLPIASNQAVTTSQRLRTGLHEAWRRPVVRGLLVSAGLAMMFGTLVIPMEVVFAKRTLHAGDLGYGLLIGLWSAGMVVGSFVFAVGGRVPLRTMLSAAVVLVGAGYLGLSLAPDLAVACAFSALGGIGNTMWVTSITNGLQETVTPTSRSSVLAVLGSIYQLAPAVGFSVGGALTALTSPRICYAVAAAGVASLLVLTAAGPIKASTPLMNDRVQTD